MLVEELSDLGSHVISALGPLQGGQGNESFPPEEHGADEG